jgi:hypothetical protein
VETVLLRRHGKLNSHDAQLALPLRLVSENVPESLLGFLL